MLWTHSVDILEFVGPLQDEFTALLQAAGLSSTVSTGADR